MIKDEDVEEEDPVPLGTPRRLTMKVVIHQVAYSPSGTRSVLQSASYNFKNAIAGETTIAKYNREEVKRKSKVRAVAKFDPAKREAANAKRRKLAQPEAAPAPALLAAAPAAPIRAWSGVSRHGGHVVACNLTSTQLKHKAPALL